jgi:hypothetical protein
MVIKMNRSIFSEQSGERIIAERMRVRAVRGKNHEVRHIYHTHAKVWRDVTKEGGSGNYFECYFYADAYQDAGLVDR